MSGFVLARSEQEWRDYWWTVARVEFDDGDDHGCWLNLLRGVWEGLIVERPE